MHDRTFQQRYVLPQQKSDPNRELTWVYGSSRRALGHDFLHENALLEAAVHFHSQPGEVGTAQRNQPGSGRLYFGTRIGRKRVSG